MTTLSTINPTLADVMKRTDTDGKIAAIGELLSQTNQILDEMTVMTANQPMGHIVTIRTGLPTVYWRSFNEGIVPSKSTTVQVTEPIAMLESRSEVDEELAKLNGNVEAFRMSEDRPFLEAMNEEQARVMLYGNPATSPKEYLGLSARYSSLSAGNAQNVLDVAGGTGSGAVHTSMWLAVWGPESVYCVTPKGFAAGLEHQDLGIQTIQTQGGVTNARMQAYCALYRWKLGLVVKDWRYVVRLANIKVSDLSTLAGRHAPTVFTNLIHYMLQAIARIPSMGLGRPVFYCNRTVMSALMRLALEKSTIGLTVESAATQFGTIRNGLRFMGIPIRQVDQILNTESPVA